MARDPQTFPTLQPPHGEAPQCSQRSPPATPLPAPSSFLFSQHRELYLGQAPSWVMGQIRDCFDLKEPRPWNHMYPRTTSLLQKRNPRPSAGHKDEQNRGCTALVWPSVRALVKGRGAEGCVPPWVLPCPPLSPPPPDQNRMGALLDQGAQEPT